MKNAPVMPSDVCAGCSGAKQAPIAAVLAVYDRGLGVTIALCQECGRDVANAVGLNSALFNASPHEYRRFRTFLTRHGCWPPDQRP